MEVRFVTWREGAEKEEGWREDKKSRHDTTTSTEVDQIKLEGHIRSRVMRLERFGQTDKERLREGQ